VPTLSNSNSNSNLLFSRTQPISCGGDFKKKVLQKIQEKREKEL
jgi:hypothetical protein